MIDRKKIVETFQRIEDERGGSSHTDAGKVIAAVADELNIPRLDVRNIILAHWGIMGPI